MITRILSASVATAVAACLVGVAGTAAAAARPAVVHLPRPSGPSAIGETSVQLVDASRRDPWVAQERHRRLMISVWYPATAGCTQHAPQMLPAAARHFARTDATQTYGIPPGTIDFAATSTHACPDAEPAPGRHAVVLYSPGLGDPRTWSTTVVEDLASHGFAVVTIDHTHDASEVQFPDGRLETNAPLLKAFRNADNPLAVIRKVLAVRVADTKFVLNALPSLPIAAHLDLHRIGMFGHSAGGFEALQTMSVDPRIRVGADLDGTVGFGPDDAGPGLSPLARDGLNRPFLLMGSATNDHHTSTSWSALWRHSHGWHRDLHLGGTEHASFTDAESFVPQVADRLGPDAVEGTVGWLSRGVTVDAERYYLRQLFDRWLRGGHNHVLDHVATPFPHVEFVS